MSYPPLSGYSDYYEADQQHSPAFPSSRQSQGHQYAPVTFPSDRQPQYATSPFDWQGQGQPGYTPSASQQASPNDQYARGQRGQYEYRREATNYTTQGAASITRYTSANSPGSAQKLQSLDKLAYASGLDSQRSAYTSNSTSNKANYTKSSVAPIHRVQSPVEALPQPYQHSTSPRNIYSPAPSNPSSSIHTAGAQAMTGAGSQKFQFGRPQAQAHAQLQRPVQQHVAPPPFQRAPSRTQSATSSNVSKQRSPAGLQKPTVPREAISSVSQATSRSDLVTTNSESNPSMDAAAAHDTMPAYIDPSQVFNPYHREHEQRRKTAAEAGIRREEAEARQKDEEARMQAHKEAAANAAAAAAEATKQQERQQNEKAVAQEKKRTVDKGLVATPTSMPEDDMAMQMKMMMEKMKEFRQQDPTAFQRLWDEMRKGGANAGAGHQNKHPPLSPQIGQTPAIKPPPPPAVKLPSERQPPIPTAQAVEAVHQAAPQAPQAFQPQPTANPPRRPRKEPVRPAGLDPSVPLNGYQVIVEDNEDELPDLGRFPAERRIRQSYEKRAASLAPNSQPPAQHAPAPNRPLPATKASSGSEWSTDKREAVAKAAIDVLKADEANLNVEITPADIDAMLDLNPNYIDLCALLEQKGLKFHRGRFARQLLSSVPDLSKAQKQEMPVQFHPPIAPTLMPPPPGAMMHPMRATGPFQTPIIDPPRAAFYGGTGVGTVPPTYYQGSLAPANLKREEQKPNRKPFPPVQPDPPPGSKAAMARKRDFSELVDLTQLSDNDDYVSSSKHPRRDTPLPDPMPDPMDLLQQFATRPQASFVLESQSGAYSPTAQPADAPPEPPKKKGPILARPVNKSEALTKEYYDPRTVARDIMIAAGRHNEERPLNAHLAGMLNKHIELDSDLSTFDWDAIDPGGPPMPKVAYVDIPAAPPRYRLGEKVHRHKKRHKKEEKDIDTAPEGQVKDGTRGDGRAMPSPDKRRTPVPATGSPALFARLDLRNKPQSEAKKHSEPGPSRLRESLRGTSDVSVTPSRRKASTSLETTSRVASPASPTKMTTPDHVFPSGKRRGRPPGSKNKTTAMTAMRQHPSAPVVEIPVDSSPQSHPSFKCRFPRCGNELHNLETLRRHIRKKHAPDVEHLQEPLPYKCWWKRCPAKNEDGETFSATQEFDTMDALMAHLNETHLHELAMRFGDGPHTSPVETPNPVSSYLSNSLGQLTTPAVSLDSSLHDSLPTDSWIITSTVSRNSHANASTNSTTTTTAAPTATTTIEPIAASNGNGNSTDADANWQAFRAYLKAHKTKGVEGPTVGIKAQAEETLRAMERRKRDMGVGLDRGGCTLVNEARRQGFVHAPGVRRIVEGGG